jgi:hypothetical protein
MRPVRDALQPLVHQNTVVLVEPHDVGDGAERDEVEQGGEVRAGSPAEHGARAQLGAQPEHKVEHHPDAGQALTRESAARLIGVDDATGPRQLVAGEMVIGDQHL